LQGFHTTRHFLSTLCDDPRTPPAADTLKGARDRAILATLLYHGLRREELCGLRVRDLQQRQGVLHFRVHGKGDKTRYIPVSLLTQRLLTEYLDKAGHKQGDRIILMRLPPL
jgi:integrase/recombinase XerD